MRKDTISPNVIGLYLEAKAGQDYRLDNGKYTRPPKCRK